MYITFLLPDRVRGQKGGETKVGSANLELGTGRGAITPPET